MMSEPRHNLGPNHRQLAGAYGHEGIAPTISIPYPGQAKAAMPWSAERAVPWPAEDSGDDPS